MRKLLFLVPLFLLVALSTPCVHADHKVLLDVAEVQAEFAKPIHRNPKEAELTVIVPQSADAHSPAQESFGHLAAAGVAGADDQDHWLTL